MNRNRGGTEGQLTNPLDQEEYSTFENLCALMDNTPFNRSPYRGILSEVGEALGLRGGRRSVYKAIRVSRTLEVMVRVAEEIKNAEARRAGILREFNRTNNPQTSTDNEL